MESIYILAVVDSLDNLLLVDVLWQWQLNDESINIVVLVQLVNTCQQFLFGNVVFKAD